MGWNVTFNTVIENICFLLLLSPHSFLMSTIMTGTDSQRKKTATICSAKEAQIRGLKNWMCYVQRDWRQWKSSQVGWFFWPFEGLQFHLLHFVFMILLKKMCLKKIFKRNISSETLTWFTYWPAKHVYTVD